MAPDQDEIHFLIHFDGLPHEGSLEAVGEGWGHVEAWAMRTGDNEMRCNRISIQHMDSGAVRRYRRDGFGVWFRENV